MHAEHTQKRKDLLIVPGKIAWSVFLISVVGLFLEMLLIRWIGTEIRIFAYLQNTILVACFLGIGLGLFSSHQQIKFQQTLIPLSILLILMVIPSVRTVLGNISEALSVLDDFVIWGLFETTDNLVKISLVVIGLIGTYCLLFLVVDIFVPLGRLLGRLIDDHPNTIWVYSVNVAGSLVGTWLFVFLSFFNQPPFTWFLVFGGLMTILVIWFSRNIKTNLALLGIIVALSWFVGLVPNSLDVVWSPYQKLVVQGLVQDDTGFSKYLVTVNNTGYQAMANLSDTFTSSDPERFQPEKQGLSQYDIPLLLHPNPKNYLIVGAGSGNDAAGGIRNGAKNITAVEIDPAIISLGRKYHPENPYTSPSVNVVNNDARSFFATTTEKFDVISFSLLDSHTTTAMTNARLDHYVYTRESIEQAKSLLSDGGIMVLTFEPTKNYIGDRMANVLQDVFGEEPISFRIPRSEYGWGGVMFISGDLDIARNQINQNQLLEAYITELQQISPLSFPLTTKIATDDWPYIYLESPKIPVLFYLLFGMMLLLLFHSSIRWKIPNLITRWNRSHWHFFFLGAAFLLLEVQNISKASVVLGNTWQTNAAIISGVLIMVLLANWVAYKFPGIKISFVYLALIGITLTLYFVDLAQFAFLPYATKIIVVGSLTTLPMLFSGIIFISSFAKVERKDEALGSNMVGSLVGALLQAVTYLIGIKALLLIVAAFYALSFLALPQQFGQGDGVPSPNKTRRFF